MSDDEVIDDATEIVGDEDFVNGKFKKCGKCNRLVTNHPGYWGEKRCKNGPRRRRRAQGVHHKLEETIERRTG